MMVETKPQRDWDFMLPLLPPMLRLASQEPPAVPVVMIRDGLFQWRSFVLLEMGVSFLQPFFPIGSSAVA